MEVRSEILWFAEQMERKLRDNDHKRKWDECTQRYLVNRLFEEATELSRAVSEGRESEQSIIEEAADVANFAMMIADNVREIAILNLEPAPPKEENSE